MNALNPQTPSPIPLHFASNLWAPSTWRGHEIREGREEKLRGSGRQMKGTTKPSWRSGWWSEARPIFLPSSTVCVLFTWCQQKENVSFMTPVVSSLFSSMQELIEVDSEVVFELASYILQVRRLVFARECMCRSGWLYTCLSFILHSLSTFLLPSLSQSRLVH